MVAVVQEDKSMTKTQIKNHLAKLSAFIADVLATDSECFSRIEVIRLEECRDSLEDFLYINSKEDKKNPKNWFIPGQKYYVYYVDEDRTLQRHILQLDGLDLDDFGDLYAIVREEKYKIAFNKHNDCQFFKWHDLVVFSKDFVENKDEGIGSNSRTE